MMIRFVRRAATLALLLHVSTVELALAQQAEFAAPQPLATAENVNFAILGTKPVQPAPTLFIFALDAQRTLTSETYRQAGNILSQRGYLCVSLDLPCHGSQCRPGEAAELKGWRQRIDAGENIMDEFTERASKVLDYLIEERYADPDHVAACGTSRGGFSACYFSIADPRVKCVAAYIPVADLAAITEFQGSGSVELLDSLSLIRNAGKLADRGVWISIGDRDQRVNTDRAIEFARALSAAGSKRGPRNIELHVSSIEGHATPRNAAEQSAAWIDATLKTK